jgi:hypothetical protein
MTTMFDECFLVVGDKVGTLNWNGGGGWCVFVNSSWNLKLESNLNLTWI